MVGYLADAVVRHVADRNAARGAGFQVDGVDTDPGPHNQAAARHAVQQRVVDLELVIDHQSVAAGKIGRRYGGAAINSLMNDRQRDIGPARQHGALDVAVIEKSRIGVNYAEHAGTCRSAQPLVRRDARYCGRAPASLSFGSRAASTSNCFSRLGCSSPVASKIG